MNKQEHIDSHTDGQLKGQSPCRLARKRLFGQSATPGGRSGGLFSRAGIPMESAWIQRHISACPRCQQRFSALGRVNLGLNLIKSQSHSLDLLRRANTGAVNVLQHDLRENNQAKRLKTALPSPTLRDRVHCASHGLYQTAACITILILSKISVFSSIDRMQKHGQTTVRHFYDSQLGSNLSDDLFSDT